MIPNGYVAMRKKEKKDEWMFQKMKHLPKWALSISKCSPPSKKHYRFPNGDTQN
jgi:hypothetical protein